MRMYKFDCGCSYPVRQEKPLRLAFKVNDIPYNCPAVWQLLSKGITKGVFQLESQLGRTWTKKLKPESLEHLAALGAILRPGVLRAIDESYKCSLTELYCKRKNGELPVEIGLPCLTEVLAPTYGVMTYQEQAMKIAQIVAGFNLQEADVLRKAIGKKIAEEMAKVKVMFSEGAKRTAVITESEAQELFSWIEKSQRYSFNKCIHKDTIFRKANGNRGCFGNIGYTVEHMYKIRNDISYAKAHGHLSLYKKWKRINNYGQGLSMCEDGRVRPNTILDIQPAGKQITYKVVLQNGASIRVTSQHKFPTPQGEKYLSTLKIGDTLYVCGEYEVTDFKPINRFSDWTTDDIKARDNSGLVHDERAGFMAGSNNPGYTTGAYTEFITNSANLPNQCQLCGAIGCRLEIHHIDGDRKNNKIDNLCRLCASCHKKEEYKLGRKKWGEKGYPTRLTQIVSIEIDEEVETYDVTMAGPNHNFVTDNNIVTCNSHALSYGINGYICAYLKAHFPLQFYTSWLHYSKDKSDPQEEISELIHEAKLLDIEVVPPDILVSKTNFDNDGTKIFFGLSDIKGIGEAQAKKILAAASELRSDMTWYQVILILLKQLSASVVINLISAGTFRKFLDNRTLALAEYNALASLTEKEKLWVYENYSAYNNIIDLLKATAAHGAFNDKRQAKIQSEVQLLEKPPKTLQDSMGWIAFIEEKLLGVSLTFSKIDSADISSVNTSCKDYLAGKGGYMVFGVEVINLREITVKNGQQRGRKMAFLTVTDNSAAVEMTAFPDTWKEYRALLTKENTVAILATKDKKKDSLIIKNVYQI